jgi:DNA sulfur modification protein DndB
MRSGLKSEVCEWYVNGMSSPSFTFTFPAARGVQAGREFFVAQCPVRMLPKIFSFTDSDLPVELRAQRTLNTGRVPEIARYIVENRSDYTFSAITASIDAEVTFEPISDEDPRLGRLQVPMDARFIINDGQHRHAAFTAALDMDPTLGDETIAVVFFVDIGLARSQQMFADLNRHSVKPSASIGVLYDHREPMSELTRTVVSNNKTLRNMIEFEKSTLAPKSRKLFTLSAVHQANQALLAGRQDDSEKDLVDLAGRFWEAVIEAFPEWQRSSSSDIRSESINAHGTVLHALGRAANAFTRDSLKVDWAHFTKTLQKIDWSRRNTKLWEGRALQAGHVSKSTQSVSLTSAVIKRELGLDLSADEARYELALGGATK